MDSRYSLKLNNDFRHVYSKGKNHVSSFVVVYAVKNRHEFNRVGYTVSTKLGHAVVRNRIRRQLREIVRINSPLLKDGYDIVVVARRKCIGKSYSKIEKAFLDACSEIELLK